MLDEQNPAYSRCIRCDTCDGFPCLVHAKADAETVCVRPALEHPNVTLVTNAEVTKLETSASGRAVTRVVVRRNGETEAYAGSIIVVAAGAANTARILLRSANDTHPRGLANGSDEDAPAFAPGFALDQMARHAVDFWLTNEDLPDPNNRVVLNDQGQITLHYTFNN